MAPTAFPCFQKSKNKNKVITRLPSVCVCVSVDIYSVMCWAFHILGRRFFIFMLKQNSTDLFHRFFWCTGRVILYAGWGGKRRETCQHRQWLAGPLSAAVKQEGNKKNSWSTHRLLSDMTTSGCQWTVSKPLNTHTQNWYISFLSLCLYGDDIIPPLSLNAQHVIYL